MRLGSLCFIALLGLSACTLIWGDVILTNEEREARFYSVHFGDSRLTAQPEVTDLTRLELGERVVIGSTRALADSGGVAVTLFSIPRDTASAPELIRTDVMGANYLRRVYGDVILGAD